MFLFFGFLFAIVVSIPELYSLLKQSKNWVPVNFLPLSLGDDYHYFSIQNIFHIELCRFLRFGAFDTSRFSSNTKFQFLIYCVNEPLYALGTIFKDKRLSIFLIKVAEKFFYFYSSSMFLSGLQLHFENHLSNFSIILVVLTNYLLWPGICNIFSLRNSIVFNFANKNHILLHSHQNDLVRSYFSGMSGPIFLFALTLSFSTAIEGIPLLILNIFLILILFFTYMPISFVFSITVAFHSISQNYFVYCIIYSVLIMSLLIIYNFFVSKDSVGEELFATAESSLFHINIKKILVLTINVVLLIAITYYASFDFSNPLYILLCVNTLLSATIFLKKHQYSRFWNRGTLIPSHLIYSALLYNILLISMTSFDESPFRYILLGVLVSILLVYTLIQASSLFVFNYYHLENWDGRKINSFDKTNPLLFNSILLSMYGNWMYGNADYPIANYSILTFSYKKNIKNFICFLKENHFNITNSEKLFLSSLSDNQFMSLRRKILSSSKTPKSMLLQNDELIKYCWQFALTNMSFNGKLRVDGFYKDGKINCFEFSNLWSQLWKNSS